MNNPIAKLIIIVTGTGLSILLAAFHQTAFACIVMVIVALLLVDYFKKNGNNGNDAGCSSGCGSGCGGCGGGCGGCGG